MRIFLICLLLLAAGCRKKTSDISSWKELNSTEGHFHALMPSPWIERSRRIATPAGLVTSYQYQYEVAGNDLNYAITYEDFSAAQLREAPLDRVIDANRQGVIQKNNGMLEGDRPIILDGFRGREVVINVPGSGKYILRYYVVNLRLYTISVNGTSANSESRDVQTFFGSLRFSAKMQ
jgi:hypothetical protein